MHRIVKGDPYVQTISADPLSGTMLGGYQIERLLGQSQLGMVYLAEQPSLGRAVVLTVFTFPERLSAQERNQFLSRFAQERAAITRLSHPHILPVYDFSEQAGSLYLVTALVRGASLAQILKEQGRFTPDQALSVLKQLAAGLDYAHSQGVTHGFLSLSNVLVNTDLTVQIAGFGLKPAFDLYGSPQNRHPQFPFFTASGTFLGNPEYISPERVQGMPVDARADTYALGVMLFQLLTATLPFGGDNALDMALKRLQQPVPSLHAVCQDVPEAFDLLISKALERDPAKRYQHAGDITTTFERVLNVLKSVERSSTLRGQQVMQGAQITLPPTINWLDEEKSSTGRWQLIPPVVTGHLPVVAPASSTEPANCVVIGNPSATVQPDSPTEMRPNSMPGIDPFTMWSTTSAKPQTSMPAPGTFTARPTTRPVRSTSRTRRQPAQQDRRKLVTLIAVGAAGALTVSGISFANFIQSMKQPTQQTANAPTTGTTSTRGGSTPTTGTTQGTGTTPNPSLSPTAKASPSATKGTQPSPTTQPGTTPTPKPTQPGTTPTPKPTQPPPTSTPPPHTGTVIGHTNQPTNSAVSFTNPADGQAGLLVHLGNGNFVACERACTHVGVPVNYDAGSGRLVCPAHNAIFDPLNGFSQVPGTGPSGLKPLPGVTIRVNADGTITTG